MLKLEGKIVNNNLSRQEILDNLVICNTNFDDVIDIAEILSKNMGISDRNEALFQLQNSCFDYENSIKIIDKRNQIIYGVLVLSKFSIYNGSPLSNKGKFWNIIFKNLSQINGFLFVVDERLRGCKIDKKMLKFAEDYIMKHDLCWIAVEKDLKTHYYWKRLGFVPILEIKDATFYIKILNNNALVDIYNNIKEYYKNEIYYNRVS